MKSPEPYMVSERLYTQKIGNTKRKSIEPQTQVSKSPKNAANDITMKLYQDAIKR